MTTDWPAYFRSLSDELKSQAMRVRHLIADSHWLSDGHHKEYLLTSLIQRHLPSGMMAGRGFIADPASRTTSLEQDILIIDCTACSPLFNQGGLIIALPHTVVGTISVKSTMSSQTLHETVKNQNSARTVVAADSSRKTPHFSCGFFFEVSADYCHNPARVISRLKEVIKKHHIVYPLHIQNGIFPAGPDLLCTSDSLTYTLRVEVDSATGERKERLSGYTVNGMGTAIFLASLMDRLCSHRGQHSADFSQIIDSPEINESCSDYIDIYQGER